MKDAIVHRVDLSKAEALMRSERWDDAESVVLEIVSSEPASAEAASTFARIAQRRRDLPEAIRRWQRVIELRPDLPDAYRNRAQCFSDMRRYGEARQALSPLLEREFVDVHTRTLDAWITTGAGNWEEAGTLWANIREMFPNERAGYLGGGVVLRAQGRLREAAVLLEDAACRFPGDFQVEVDLASLAAQREDWPEAVRRWSQLAVKFPMEERPVVGLISAYRKCGRSAEAEAEFLAAETRLSMTPALLAEHAQDAVYRRAWPEAVRRWERMLDTFPHSPDAYTGLATALSETGQHGRAEALLSDAIQRFPDNASLYTAYASLATYQGAWEISAKRWADVCERFPNSSTAIAQLACAYRELKRFEDSENLLQSAFDKFPSSVEISIQYSLVAQRRGDSQEGLRRWQAAHKRFAENGYVWAGLGGALLECECPQQAEELLNEAVDRFPTNPDVLTQYASVAVRQMRWQEALKRWKLAQSRVPNHVGIANGIGIALWHAQLEGLDLEDARPFMRPVEIQETKESELTFEAVQKINLHDLFMQCEGLGDNCEFGIVQREYGAEPLGLLRWASTSPEMLAQALDAKLEGVGDPDKTEVGLQNREYYVKNTKFNMSMHTFINENEAEKTKVHAQQVKRIQFLKRKFLEDISTGEKLFVYKRSAGMTLAQAELLNRALKAHGNNMLLCVLLQDETHPNGLVELREKGLLIGYIDKLSPSASRPTMAINSWTTICARAYQMWKTTLGVRTEIMLD